VIKTFKNPTTGEEWTSVDAAAKYGYKSSVQFAQYYRIWIDKNPARIFCAPEERKAMAAADRIAKTAESYTTYTRPSDGKTMTANKWAVEQGIAHHHFTWKVRNYGTKDPRTWEKKGAKFCKVDPEPEPVIKTRPISPAGSWEIENIPDRFAHLTGIY